MTSFSGENIVAKPVRQMIKITIEPKRFYPLVVWELIALHILEIVGQSPNIDVSTDKKADMQFGKPRWRHQQDFELEFEVTSSQSMFDQSKMMDTLRNFFISLDIVRVFTTMERADKK